MNIIIEKDPGQAGLAVAERAKEAVIAAVPGADVSIRSRVAPIGVKVKGNLISKDDVLKLVEDINAHLRGSEQA